MARKVDLTTALLLVCMALSCGRKDAQAVLDLSHDAPLTLTENMSLVLLKGEWVVVTA